MNHRLHGEGKIRIQEHLISQKAEIWRTIYRYFFGLGCVKNFVAEQKFDAQFSHYSCFKVYWDLDLRFWSQFNRFIEIRANTFRIEVKNDWVRTKHIHISDWKFRRFVTYLYSSSVSFWVYQIAWLATPWHRAVLLEFNFYTHFSRIWQNFQPEHLFFCAKRSWDFGSEFLRQSNIYGRFFKLICARDQIILTAKRFKNVPF